MICGIVSTKISYYQLSKILKASATWLFFIFVRFTDWTDFAHPRIPMEEREMCANWQIYSWVSGTVSVVSCRLSIYLCSISMSTLRMWCQWAKPHSEVCKCSAPHAKMASGVKQNQYQMYKKFEKCITLFSHKSTIGVLRTLLCDIQYRSMYLYSK